jgi:hypothetical protein
MPRVVGEPSKADWVLILRVAACGLPPSFERAAVHNRPRERSDESAERSLRAARCSSFQHEIVDAQRSRDAFTVIELGLEADLVDFFQACRTIDAD